MKPPDPAAPPDTTSTDQTAVDKAAADKAAATAKADAQTAADKAAATKAAKIAADQAASDAAINAAVAAAAQAGTGGTGTTKLGPTLSGGQVDDLHRAIAKKWNIGALSTEASKVVIVVSVTLTQDQKVQDIQLLSFTGGSQAAANLAFEVAARAVKRAAIEGLNLPPEKYDDWKDLELTFNPTTKTLQ